MAANKQSSNTSSGRVKGGSRSSALPATTTTGTRPKRTPAQQQLLDAYVKVNGGPLTVQKENLIIAQAEMMGDL